MPAFYKDSEKWATDAYIKISYLGKSDTDLKYQDEVHGFLSEQVDKMVDLEKQKELFMKALISSYGKKVWDGLLFKREVLEFGICRK